MPTVEEALVGVNAIGLDTPAFIYLIEENAARLVVVEEILTRIHEGLARGVTSALTLAEVLPVPIRIGNTELAESYRSIILDSRNLLTAPVTTQIAESAADVRARYALRTPDAI